MSVRDPEGNVILRRPDGRVTGVRPHSVDAALAHGYTAVPDDEAQALIKKQLVKAAGSPLQKALTVPLEMASTMSLGTSDLLGAGLDKLANVAVRRPLGKPDHIPWKDKKAARAEANPGAAFIGRTLGIVVPAVFTGGGSVLVAGKEATKAMAKAAAKAGGKEAVKEGSKGVIRTTLGRALGTSGLSGGAARMGMTPQAQVQRLGTAITRKLMPTGGGKAVQITGRLGAMSAGAATEGAISGVADRLAEGNVIGNPEIAGELGAEALMGATGGVAMGLGLGAVSSVAKTGARAVGKRLPGWRQVPAEYMEGTIGGGTLEQPKGYPGYLGRKGLTDTPSDMADLIQKRHHIIREPEQRFTLAKRLADTLQDQDSAVAQEIRDVSLKVRRPETWRLIRQDEKAGKLGDWRQSYVETLNALNGAINRMQERRDLHVGYYRAFLEEVRDSLMHDANKVRPHTTRGLVAGDNPEQGLSASWTFLRLNQVKQRLDDLAKYAAKVDPKEKHSIDQIRALADQIRLGLENEATWGQAATRQRDYNKALARLLSAQAKAEKEIDFLTVVDGKRAFEVDPVKLEMYINKTMGGRGQRRQAAIDELLDSIDDWRAEAENSLANVPGQRKRIHLNSTLSARRAHDAAYEAGTATQRWKQRFSSDILTSAPGIQKLGGTLGKAASPMALSGLVGSQFMGPIGGLGALGVTGALQARSIKRDPRQMMALLEAYEHWEKKHAPRLEGWAKSLSSAQVEAPRTRAIGAQAAGAYSRALFRSDGKLDPQAGEQLRSDAANPEKLLQDAAALAQQGQDGGPDAAAAIQATATTIVRGKEFLASKYPDAGVGLDGKPLEPSASAVAKFRRYVEAVENPSSVFEHARAGTLTAEHVEALREVYPALFGQFGQVLLSSLGGTGAKPTYQQSLMRERILGTEPHGARSLGRALRARRQSQQHAPEPTPTPARADKLGLSGRMTDSGR